MKVKIDEHGLLYIKRVGKWKHQRCPINTAPDADCTCGDWCPLFDDPKDGALFLCKRILRGNITDERNQDET